MALSRKKLRLLDNSDIIGVVLIMGLPDAQIDTIISNAKAELSSLPEVYKNRFFRKFLKDEQDDLDPNLGRYDNEQEANPTIPGE